MEVRIGVRNVSREVVLEVDRPAEQVKAAVTQALAKDEPLVLEDDKGHTVIVPAQAIGYLDLGAEQGRRVGFGG